VISEYDIKMDLMEIGCEVMNWIKLVQRQNQTAMMMIMMMGRRDP
jgi:hypothetical protein